MSHNKTKEQVEKQTKTKEHLETKSKQTKKPKARIRNLNEKQRFTFL